MEKRHPTYFRYTNSGRLAKLADSIFELEDEFKICRKTGQHETAAIIELQLGELYQSLMHNVKKQSLKTIEVTQTKIKVTYERIKTPAIDGNSQ